MRADPALSDWSRFVVDGNAAGTVRSEIRESWQRCAEAGIDPAKTSFDSGRDESAVIVGADSGLAAASRPFIDFIACALRGRTYMAGLVDGDGRCVTLLGNPDMIKAKEDTGLSLGSSWNEATIGTNGAGTSLAVGVPIIVSGPEHYCRALHDVVSMGAPIFGPEGTPAGVVVLVFPLGDSDPAHFTALVAAARVIEGQLGLMFTEKRVAAIRRSMVAAGLFHVVVVDSEGRIMDASHNTASPGGADRVQPPPAGFETGQHPATREALSKGEKVYQRWQDDNDREYEILSVPLAAAGGAPFGAVTLAVDRTDEARLSRRLEESSAMLSSFTKVEDVLVTIVDPECRLVHVSRLAARILGADPEVLVGRHIREFFAPDMTLAVERALEERRVVALDQWVMGHDRVNRLMHVLSVPVYAGRRLVGAVALGVDMTSAHESAKRASRAETVLRALFETPDAMACLTDSDGVILELSESAARRMGAERRSLVGANLRTMISGDSEFLQALHAGQSYYGVKRSKAFGCLRSLVVPVKDSEGVILGTLSVAQDGSEEEKIQSLKAGLFASQSIGVIVIDSERIVCEINDCALKLVDMERNWVVGRSVSELFAPAARRAILGYLDSQTLSPPILEQKGEGEAARWIEAIVTPVAQEGTQSGAVLFIRDATERVLLVQRSRHIEQLEMVGQLAAMAAHEFRNPLSSIRAAAGLGRRQVPADLPRVAELFGKIENYVDEINDSLEQILYLGRPEGGPLRPGAVVPVLTQAMESVEYLARQAGVRMELRCTDENLSALLEPKALGRAIANLLRNSIQAMQGGGYVEITAQGCGENQVEIVVHDTGPGIAESVRNRLFEPFLSTRVDGNGLGLSIVNQIITEIHRGTLEVFTEEGEGTAAVIHLKGLPD